jgi:hypothetical protein
LSTAVVSSAIELYAPKLKQGNWTEGVMPAKKRAQIVKDVAKEPGRSHQMGRDRSCQ